MHHAASASGLPVPSRAVALSPDTAIESWAPTQAVGVNIEVLEWIASQMRGKRRRNRALMTLVATLVGAADAAAGATAERVRHRHVIWAARRCTRYTKRRGHLPRRFYTFARRGYFPAVFCLPAVEPDGAAREAGGVEIALRRTR